jgi:hypothetical protein
MPILSLRNIEDRNVIKRGEIKNIDTTVDKGKLASATKKKYIAITRHIPLIENKIKVRLGSNKVFLAPCPIMAIIKMHISARITTI